MIFSLSKYGTVRGLRKRGLICGSTNNFEVKVFKHPNSGLKSDAYFFNKLFNDVFGDTA